MPARQLRIPERLAIVVGLGALFSVLGLLIARTTATTGALRLFPTTTTTTLIPRGEIPFMQTVKALGTNGGDFFTLGHPQTPTWIIISLVVGFGAVWVAFAVAVLGHRPVLS
ncbi:MAG TPA: hypothetical protein VEJ84_00470 [Acidimicrobiales bacterium]|nr:hypothetical protein [Acidimicrobiales bacterium]